MMKRAIVFVTVVFAFLISNLPSPDANDNVTASEPLALTDSRPSLPQSSDGMARITLANASHLELLRLFHNEQNDDTLATGTSAFDVSIQRIFALATADGVMISRLDAPLEPAATLAYKDAPTPLGDILALKILDSSHILLATQSIQNDEYTLFMGVLGLDSHFFEISTLTAPITTAVFNTQGTILATGDSHGTIHLWDLTLGTVLLSIEGAEDAEIRALAFSLDATLLVSGGADKTLRLWDATSGNLLSEFSGHQHPINAVAISSDNTQIASASGEESSVTSADYTARIWDIASTSEKLSIPHNFSVNAIAFSPDGTLLATSGADTALYLWNTLNGQAVTRLADHLGDVVDVSFSVDSSILAASDASGMVYLWGIGQSTQP